MYAMSVYIFAVQICNMWYKSLHTNYMEGGSMTGVKKVVRKCRVTDNEWPVDVPDNVSDLDDYVEGLNKQRPESSDEFIVVNS